MVAFLGMGLLGSNFVRAMIKKGIQVQVWNRTAKRAEDLAQFGAQPFTAAADAVRNAEIVHITLKDDATVDEVLAQAEAGLKPGAIIIDHTTTSVAGAIERTKVWKQKGFVYQHAPVFMGPQNAFDGTGYMLVSGDQELIGQLAPILSPMTGKLINFGAEAGRAAGMKLIGNSFLVGMTAGLADTLLLSKALDVPLEDVTTLFDNWNPGAMLPARLQRMSGGNYEKPSWELNMARKDTQLFIDAARSANIPLVVIPSIAKEMDRWIEKGYGNNDWTVIGKDGASRS